MWLEETTNVLGEIMTVWHAATRTVHVTVRSVAGNDLVTIVTKTTTISELKQTLAKRRRDLGPWQSYELLYGSHLLENGNTLVQCGFDVDDVLNLCVQWRGETSENSTDESMLALTSSSSSSPRLPSLPSSVSSASSSPRGYFFTI